MKQASRFLVIIQCMVIYSCDKEPKSPFDFQTTWDCHHDLQWDYQTTKNAIIGEWQWVFINCCGEGASYQNMTEFTGLTVEFNEDSTGLVVRDLDSVDFTWDLKLREGDLFGLVTDPLISQLDGRLLICDDKMICNAHYIDGFDNYYIRIK